MNFKNKVSRLADELHELTGIPWDVANGKGRSKGDYYLRPKNIIPLNSSRYRFGLKVEYVSGRIWVGVDLTHVPEVGKLFAEFLSKDEGRFARMEIADFFASAPNDLEIVVDESNNIHIDHNSNNPKFHAYFSGLPKALEREVRSNHSGFKYFGDPDNWIQLKENFPSRRKGTGKNSRLDTWICYFRLHEVYSIREFNPETIWKRWKHCIGSMSIQAKIRSKAVLNTSWKTSQTLWREFMDKSQLKETELLCCEVSCQQKGRKNLHLDHFIPKSSVSTLNRRKENYDSVMNLVPLCSGCHKEKTRLSEISRPRVESNSVISWGAFKVDAKKLKRQNPHFKLLPYPKI